MKILHLTLKKQWFLMIASGEKKEEYREIKPYWLKRLGYYDLFKDGVVLPLPKPKHFDIIRFTNGYAKDAPRFDIELRGIEIGYGKPEWGAVFDEKYFVLQLGNILNTK